MKVDRNCKLLLLGLLQLFSCKNVISSKQLNFGEPDVAAPDFVILVRFPRHYFRLAFRFFNFRYKYPTIIKNNSFIRILAAPMVFNIFIGFDSNLF